MRQFASRRQDWRPFEIIGIEDVIVIDEDQKLRCALADAAKAGGSEADRLLADVPSIRSAVQAILVSQTCPAGVVYQQQLPLLLGQCLVPECVQYPAQIMGGWIVCADDDRNLRRSLQFKLINAPTIELLGPAH